MVVRWWPVQRVTDIERPDAPVRAGDIETLISLWSRDRRSKGGWWALAGFSFQSALYLLRFFQGIQGQAKSPSELAKTELLSDILVPKDGTFTLIQVKRTLDRPRLVSALREAYEIAKLCNTALLANLRFKIACIECTTPTRPKDISLAEIGGDSVDTELWTQLLSCFDENDAIVEEPDPLDHLYDFLWHEGITDAAGFVDSCLGILLRIFASPSQEAIGQLAWHLSQLFHTVRDSGRGPAKRIGLSLTGRDVELSPEARADRGILFDRRPQLSDLQLGRVRERQSIFSGLIKAFAPWWRKVITAEEAARIPVFWIEGRSGEGKSVLLLQLVQRILTDGHSPVLSYLSSADELPEWIENQRRIQRNQTNPAQLPAVAVVDDLHFVREREEWEKRLRAATDLIVPRIAVLACGPTVERETFNSDFSTFFDVSSFSIPNLERAEMEAFREWLSERTGRSAQLDASDVDNRMLVVWIFELLRGESIREFASNFRRRLIALGLFDLARAIVATNALELPAPTKLVESISDIQRDRFSALCLDSQLHFEKVENAAGTAEGYRLSHPQIDWQLYREWASPPGTLAQHWGRDLAPSYIANANASNQFLAGNLIYRLMTSSKLLEGAVDALHVEVGTIGEALSELYRKQTAELLVERAILFLPRWLEVLFRGLARNLDPDPIQQAIDLAGHELYQKELPPPVAGWLWRLGEIEEYRSKQTELCAATLSIVFVTPPKPGIGWTLSVIAAKSSYREDALRLCKRWLNYNPIAPQAFHILSTIVGGWPSDGEILVAARHWLESNLTHPKSYHVLASLVAAHTEDDKVVGVAIKWVEDNPTHEEAHWLFAPLVRARPVNDRLASVARKWVEDNPAHRQAYYVLAALVAARATDDEMVDVALNCVKYNPTHQQSYQLLAPLVAARHSDENVINVALKWVEDNPKHKHAYQVLAPLVAANRTDDKVVKAALNWLEENSEHQQAHELIRVLVAVRPTDENVVSVGRIWLAVNTNHRQGHSLLTTLITRSNGAEEWMQMGENALLNAKDGAKRSLLVALLAASKANQHYIELTLETIEIESYGNKTFLLVSLGRSLANNVQNALLFLAGRSTSDHKRRAAQSLAHGLRKYPNRAEEFLALSHTSPPEYTGFLLSACIASEASGEVLNGALRHWLNDHQRALGYRLVLKALKQYPARWEALKEFGGLNLAVQLDYINQ